jgi:biopolymer transport protein ExbD
MAHIESRFTRKRRISGEIPTGSMADISFLLVIFFMVTTTFVTNRGFPVNLPAAEKIEPLLSRRNIVNVWVSPQGRIMVDEFDTDLAGVGKIVRAKLEKNPRIVVLVKSDRDTEFRVVSGVIGELRKASALRVSFIATKDR